MYISWAQKIPFKREEEKERVGRGCFERKKERENK